MAVDKNIKRVYTIFIVLKAATGISSLRRACCRELPVGARKCGGADELPLRAGALKAK